MKKFAEVDLRLAQIWFGMAILWDFRRENRKGKLASEPLYESVSHARTHIQMLIA